MREMIVKERRIDRRFRVRLPVSVLAAHGTMIGETKDISRGGAFIRCEEPPPPGEKVLVNFGQLSGKMQVVFAEVAWANLESQDSSNNPVGMGIQFI